MRDRRQDIRMVPQKQVLRTQVKQALRAITQRELVQQSETLSRLALRVIDAQGYRHVACFLNMEHSEVKTEPLLESLFREGKTVYLPRCTTTRVSKQKILRGNHPQADDQQAGHHAHLTFYAMSSIEQVRALKPQGKYQLREPQAVDPEPLPPQELEVILMPGVAFSKKNGARMGHGAGYYDDYITRHLHYTGKKPLLVGLALKEQLVDDVPVEEHDYTVDCLVSGDGEVTWYGPRPSPDRSKKDHK